MMALKNPCCHSGTLPRASDRMGGQPSSVTSSVWISRLMKYPANFRASSWLGERLVMAITSPPIMVARPAGPAHVA